MMADKAAAVASFPHIWLTCLGLGIFLAVFLGALAWVYRQGSRGFYGQLGQLPLFDEMEPGTTVPGELKPHSGPDSGRERAS